MKKLLVATNNRGKLAEIRAILGDVCDEIVSYADIGLDIDPAEDGETFSDNALIKARCGCKASGLPTLADDSGICADALDGAPGVHSARFAGGHGDSAKNNEKLAAMLKKLPEDERTVYFACSMALVLPDGREYCSYGECRGLFAMEPRGQNGFGYDPHFYLPERGRTMAELMPEEKNSISHRYNALMDMKRIIGERRL